jgi:hypothetical protein
MTVTELIGEVTTCVRNSFYADKLPREFKRDERAIMRSIARYGAECDRRGWHFQADFIFHELLTLLKAIKTSGADIKYLPVYLEGAVDRHIRMRAEELSAQAKSAKNVDVLARRTMDGVKVVQVVEKSTVETLALLYKDLQKRQKVKRQARPATAVKASAQPSLL